MPGIEYLIFAVLSALTGVLFLYLPIDSRLKATPNPALARFKQYRGLLVTVCFSWTALMLALWFGII
jgi:hypothetical protein